MVILTFRGFVLKLVRYKGCALLCWLEIDTRDDAFESFKMGLADRTKNAAW